MENDPFEDFLSDNLSLPDLELSVDMRVHLYEAAGLSVGAGLSVLAASKAVSQQAAPAVFDWAIGEKPISPEVVEHLSSSPDAVAELKSDISFLRRLKDSLSPTPTKTPIQWSQWIALASAVTILGILTGLAYKGVDPLKLSSLLSPPAKVTPVPSVRSQNGPGPAGLPSTGNPQVSAMADAENPVTHPSGGQQSADAGLDHPQDPWGNGVNKAGPDESPIKSSSESLTRLAGQSGTRMSANDYAGGLSIARSGVGGIGSAAMGAGDGGTASLASVGSSFSGLGAYQDSFSGNTFNGVSTRPPTTAQIPEPGVAVLTLLGALSLLIRRRK